jgi:hypothetical protein
MLVVIVLSVVVDLQYSIGLFVGALDDDVDDRDDAVRRIKRWQVGIRTCL